MYVWTEACFMTTYTFNILNEELQTGPGPGPSTGMTGGWKVSGNGPFAKCANIYKLSLSLLENRINAFVIIYTILFLTHGGGSVINWL